MGKHVLIIGAARQGQALARYLNGQKARVILNDKNASQEMLELAADFERRGIECVFGSHPIDLLDRVELVCLSGGVPLTLPIVQAAMERGLPITNDSQIFLESVKARVVIGITGSAGKTTTTTLVGRIAKEAVKAPNQAGSVAISACRWWNTSIRSNRMILLFLNFPASNWSK
jgi:UDP-N-acetylmuramoylalanine--D-glutamate ligase